MVLVVRLILTLDSFPVLFYDKIVRSGGSWEENPVHLPALFLASYNFLVKDDRFQSVSKYFNSRFSCNELRGFLTHKESYCDIIKKQEEGSVTFKIK